MKKLLILSIATFSLFSCSSDNDNIDPLVGTWTLFSFNNQEVNDCKKKSTLTFIENNTFTSTPYVTLNNICIINGESSGTWENKGNNIYSIDTDGKIIFSNNNNTFTVTTYNANGSIDDITVHNRIN